MGASYTYTQRAECMLRKAAAVAIKGSLRDMVDAWVDQIADVKEVKEAKECMSTLAFLGRRTAVSAWSGKSYFKGNRLLNNNNWLP